MWVKGGVVLSNRRVGEGIIKKVTFEQGLSSCGYWREQQSEQREWQCKASPSRGAWHVWGLAGRPLWQHWSKWGRVLRGQSGVGEGSNYSQGWNARLSCRVFQAKVPKKNNKSCISMLFVTLLQGKPYPHCAGCLQELINDSGLCSLGMSEPLRKEDWLGSQLHGWTFGSQSGMGFIQLCNWSVNPFLECFRVVFLKLECAY